MKYRLISSWSVLALAAGTANLSSAETDAGAGLPVSKTEDWQRLVQGFREGHHFGLGLHVSQFEWSGSVDGYEGSVEGFNRAAWSVSAKAFYAFYLPILGGAGYYLGTVTQFPLLYWQSEGNLTADYVDLPGIVAGLSYDFNPRSRVTLGLEANLRRFYRFKLDSGLDATFTARAWAISLTGDYFYDFESALRIELHQDRLKQKSNDNIRLGGSGFSLSFTWVRHLI